MLLLGAGWISVLLLGGCLCWYWAAVYIITAIYGYEWISEEIHDPGGY